MSFEAPHVQEEREEEEECAQHIFALAEPDHAFVAQGVQTEVEREQPGEPRCQARDQAQKQERYEHDRARVPTHRMQADPGRGGPAQGIVRRVGEQGQGKVVGVVGVREHAGDVPHVQ